MYIYIYIYKFIYVYIWKTTSQYDPWHPTTLYFFQGSAAVPRTSINIYIYILVAPERRTQNARSGTQITLFRNATSKRNQIARMVSKWLQNATRHAIQKRNFKTQPQILLPDDEKAASSEISKRNSLDLIPGCCTKVRRPHGTKTVEIHQICTSGFRTQSERNRNATIVDIGPDTQNEYKHVSADML